MFRLLIPVQTSSISEAVRWEPLFYSNIDQSGQYGLDRGVRVGGRWPVQSFGEVGERGRFFRSHRCIFCGESSSRE